MSEITANREICKTAGCEAHGATTHVCSMGHPSGSVSSNAPMEGFVMTGALGMVARAEPTSPVT